ATKVDYATGSTPTSVAMGDITGDGKVDIAVTNHESNTISLYVNNGDGTFATKVDYATNSNPTKVAIGDVNGDGKADLAVCANVWVSIYLNRADPLFYAQASTGRVGIGTTSPQYTLDVAGNIRVGTDVYFGNIGLGSTGGASLIGVNTTGFGISTAPTVQGQLAALNDAVSSLSGNTFTDGGNYVYPTSGKYIGISSTAALGKINGLFLGDTSPIIFGKDNDFRMVYNSAGNLVIGDSSNNFLSINDGGTAGNFAFNTNHLYVASNGRVGIGTATPQAAFDVRGDIFTDRWANSGTNLLIGGTVAGAGNLIGLYNTILGGIAFNNITSGHSNVGIGYQAGYSNTSGLQNVAIGIQSLYYNQSGQQNVAIGGIAGNGNVGSPSFSYNVLIGYGSGYSLLNNANYNTLLGHAAGDNITAGTGNIVIGANIDAPQAIGNNQLNIGNLIRGTLGVGATIQGNATLGTSSGTHAHRIYGTITADTLYTTTVGGTNRDLYVDNTGVIGYVSSSERYKENINSLNNIDWLYNLRPVDYEYKNDSTNTLQYGLIAEEVNSINPLLVSYNDQGIPETVSYSKLVTPLLKAVQNQRSDIISLSNNLAALNLPDINSLVNKSIFNILEHDVSSLEDIQIKQGIKLLEIESSIADIRNRIDLLKPIASEEATIANLSDRVSFLEQMLFGKEASSSAELAELINNTSNYPDGEVLGIEDSKLTLEDLTVTGKTNLFNLGVVGDISVGQIVVRGNESAINSLALPLQIQSEATAAIEFMAGKVVIDTDGNITVEKEITAKKYNVDITDKEASSIGKDSIKVGETEVIIKTKSVTSSSNIFLTATIETDVPLAVVEKIAGQSFKVKIVKEAEEDISFNWWIVN
ncbi:MAG TPA: FG-GAP-like repeat-containing protein, partial [Candidatus Woesebacteria bacterium]|nr:FG-GAP-like repeat-containing protein [Candidatus Woesebacteria bacterium]